MWDEKPRLRLLATLTPPRIEETNSERVTSEEDSNDGERDDGEATATAEATNEIVIEPWQCTQLAWMQPKRGKSILFVGYGTKQTVIDGSSTISLGDHIDDHKISKETEEEDSEGSELFRTAFFSGELPYQFDKTDYDDDHYAADQPKARTIIVNWSDDLSSPLFSAKDSLPEAENHHYYAVAVPCSQNLDICRSINT